MSPDVEAIDDETAAFLESTGVAHDAAPVESVARTRSGTMVLTTATGILEADSVFHKVRVEQQSDLAARLGARLLDDGSIAVDAGQQTSVAGVFAAGDCARADTSPGPSGFAASGAGDGQRAAVWLEQSLLREDLVLPPMR